MLNYLPKINKKPLIKTIRTNLSPEDIYSGFAESPDTSLLNSSLNTDAGRYSFIGLYPFLSLKGKSGKMRIETAGHTISIAEDPFNCIKSILKTYKTVNPGALPFSSGGIGYFSYDLKDVLEKLDNNSEDDIGLPDIYFVFYRAILIFDRLDPGKLTISALNINSKNYSKAKDLIKKIRSTVKNIPNSSDKKRSSRKPFRPELVSNFTRDGYISAINKVLEYIKAGDIYQVCISQRFKTKWPYSPYELYESLNKVNPAPFSAYLNFDGFKIISSSPELFLRSDGKTVETRPMKGTRPRGITPEEDKTLSNALMNDPKEDAELSMIVDLERNDLGKISVPGTVTVAEHRRIEKYPTVFQTISIVKSIIENNTSFVDVIKAAFPGGSISGCPKVRAMEIINELEPTKRNIYTGAIGYLSFHNTMDLNIAIRTMLVKGSHVYFQAGGGITSDSIPEKEYDETLDKAKALISSLRQV